MLHAPNPCPLRPSSSSRSVAIGRESLTASTSNDRTRRSGHLSAAWHVLDFGVSYYGAKQQADRTLIAHERRRRAVQVALAGVRCAWWRAVAAERALARVEPLLARVEDALAATEEAWDRGEIAMQAWPGTDAAGPATRIADDFNEAIGRWRHEEGMKTTPGWRHAASNGVRAFC